MFRVDVRGEGGEGGLAFRNPRAVLLGTSPGRAPAQAPYALTLGENLGNPELALARNATRKQKAKFKAALCKGKERN